MNHAICPMLCALLWLPLFWVQAATSPDVFTFTMTAEVREPASCHLNDGKDVEIDFGERVDIARINGLNYKTAVDYQFHCERVGENRMTLEIGGADADFGQGMLYVRPGFGIRIFAGDVEQPVNVPFSIDGHAPPALMAVPVKAPGAVLTPGAFEATAVIKVLYE